MSEDEIRAIVASIVMHAAVAANNPATIKHNQSMISKYESQLIDCLALRDQQVTHEQRVAAHDAIRPTIDRYRYAVPDPILEAAPLPTHETMIPVKYEHLAAAITFITEYDDEGGWAENLVEAVQDFMDAAAKRESTT